MSKINSNVSISCNTKDVPSYIREILTLNLCSLFFPVSYVVDGENIKGNYNVQGYRAWNSIKECSTETVFNILIELLKKIWQCENHYIFCDEYEISGEYIFIDKSYSDIKMVYVPADDSCTGPERLINLIAKFRERVDEEGQVYIDNAINYISNTKFSYRAIIHYLEELRREVYLCAVK